MSAEEQKMKRNFLEISLLVAGVFLVFLSLILSPSSHHYMMMGPYYLGILPSILGIAGFGLIVFSIFKMITGRQEPVEIQEAYSEAADITSDRTSDVKGNEADKLEDKLKLATKLLSEDEAKILKIIYENEGVTQDSIHFRTGFSHSKISMIMKKLEEKDLIIREKFGKTYKVHLSDWFKR
jgi:uncharacterized membrane protein